MFHLLDVKGPRQKRMHAVISFGVQQDTILILILILVIIARVSGVVRLVTDCLGLEP
jgi:hypothetical protein